MLLSDCEPKISDGTVRNTLGSGCPLLIYDRTGCSCGMLLQWMRYCNVMSLDISFLGSVRLYVRKQLH